MNLEPTHREPDEYPETIFPLPCRIPSGARRLHGWGIFFSTMSHRRFSLPKNVDRVKACPKCGNLHEFVCRSQQVCEDGCEVWITCGKCDHDPHAYNERLESVMGGCDEDNIYQALDCWNDASGHKKGWVKP